MRFSYIAAIVFLAALLAAGIFLFQKEQAENEPIAPMQGFTVFLPEQEISALLFDGEKLWVGTAEGILLLDPKSGEVLRDMEMDIHLIYSAGICRTEDGLVWVGHENGITVFRDEKPIAALAAPHIPKGRVNTVISASEGGVWIGAVGGGARVTLTGDTLIAVEVLSEDTGLAENYVSAVMEFPTGEIWFGAYLAGDRGGLSIRNADRSGMTNGWRYLSVEDGLPHRYITGILHLRDEILVGTGHLDRGGLALLSRSGTGLSVRKVFHTDDGLPGEKIRHLYSAADGTLWITTESEGLIVCPSADSLEQPGLPGLRLTQENGLSDNEIKVIAETDGYYWLGGRYGLTRIQQSTIQEKF
jgi:ligand-binding sensor domain-containing protein